MNVQISQSRFEGNPEKETFSDNTKQCKSFQIFFLTNDAEQQVAVVEVDEDNLDLDEVLGFVKQGGSVFLRCK